MMQLKSKYFFLSFLTIVFSECYSQSSVYDSFPFLKKDYNFIQYIDREDFSMFYKLWNKNPAGKITIAHFGDSHVQLDYFVSGVRTKMQSLKGDAGRGMLFPFSIAKTYSHIDFTSTFTGEWKSANSIQIPPKIPVGVSGFVAVTNQNNASFSIKFKSPLKAGVKKLSIYCKTQYPGYRLLVQTNNESREINFDSSINTDKSFFELQFNNISDSIKFILQKDTINNELFRFYGFSIENKNDGILYHNLGVGGANFSALVNQKYFDEQIVSLNPDLVILDWGTNDIIYTNKIEDTLSKTVINVINKVRSKCPKATILLSSIQDMNRKGVNISRIDQFAFLLKKIAFENRCLFYDWFSVSGGKFSMKKWEGAGAGRNDNIHLTALGYNLKSDLFFNAFMNSFDFYENNREEASLIKDIDMSIPAPISNIKIGSTKVSASPYYILKKGDNWGSLYKKFGLTKSALLKINGPGIKKLKPGQRIKLRR